MTDGELYARARVAFIGEPAARLYTRRDGQRKATRIVAEREVDGRFVRVCGLVGDETLVRDDVRRAEAVVRLVRTRYRFIVAMTFAGDPATWRLP